MSRFETWFLLACVCIAAVMSMLTLIITANYMGATYNHTYVVEDSSTVTGESRDGIYFIPAEIREQGGGKVEFATNHGVFVQNRTGYLSERCQYLLTMDGNGTESVEDDEILVIWEARDD